MILTCPECATSYFVDDSKIPAEGRSVRCAHCGARWTARPDSELELTKLPEEGALAVEPEVSKPVVEDVSALPAEELPKVFRARAEAKRNVKAAAIGGVVWAALAALVLILAGSAYVFRAGIVQTWPKTASLYAFLHIPVNPTGLEFEAVGAQPALKDGHAALMVSGKIRNIKEESVDTPALKIMLFDKDGKQVAAKIVDPENARIPPGETRHFLVPMLDPPVSAVGVGVEFVLGRKSHAAPASPSKPAHEKVELRGAVEPTQADTGFEPVEAEPLPNPPPASSEAPTAAPAAPPSQVAPHAQRPDAAAH